MSVDYQELVAETDHAWVLVENGEPLGVIVTVAKTDHLLIENVAITPKAQGRGYGRVFFAKDV